MTDAKTPLYHIREPSTNSVTDATLQLVGQRGAVRFDYYRDGSPFRSAIWFTGVIASRTTNERCCTPWHIADSYDTLCEVRDSTWLAAVKSQMPDRYRRELAARHFIICLDSVGCFELLAEEFNEPTEETGSWEELRNSLVN